MNEWDQMIARQVEADGVRMASGQHIDTPREEPVSEILSVEEVEFIRIAFAASIGSSEDCGDLCTSHEALRAEVERLTRERDAARRTEDLARRNVESHFNKRADAERRAEAAEARVASMEAALREAEAVLARTFKVLLTVKGTLDHPYPDAPTLTPWTRWCAPLSRRAYDTRRLVRAALGDQEAPTEPSEWRRDNLLPPCPACDGTGSEAHPWDDNCPRSADHADRLGWHVSDPVAPQVAPEPERRDEWRVVDDEGLVCCTEIVDLDDAHATAEMLDRDNPPERHHVERAVVTWERVPARWSAPRGEQP